MVKCVGCKYNNNCTKVFKLDECTEYEPRTNADKIRQMSDEELAGYLTGIWYSFEETPGMCDVCDKGSVQNCSECWLDWLKQEVESDA